MHAFTDGRDTLPHAGAGYLRELGRRRRARASARSSGATGRWTAIGAGSGPQRAYDLLVHGRAPHRDGQRRAGRRATPTSAARPTSSSSRRWSARRRRIRPGDSVLVLQLPARPDAPDRRGRWPSRASARARGAARLARARRRRAGRRLRDADRLRGGLALPGGLLARAPRDARSRRCSRGAGAAQLHVAETEKYPHVTYFFNGGDEAPQPGERRELVPSPRDVPTYDHKPQMSAQRGRRGVRGRLARMTRMPRGSGSSTSPTPTWSATPA